ncbi:MAG: S41 family peptidase [Oscillospiraceae bacterium]|nr:S41 family peptidase [Oscillospiraceae bacterium]
MDNLTVSAGELFISYLRQMDNVIFVGTSTTGALTISDEAENNRLPESKFHIYFGIGLNIRSDLSQFESVGFAPDLWVPPGESLDRVIKFIEQYKLKP